MEEYIEPKLSGIFWLKIVTKNIVLGSLGIHFMHMKVNIDEGYDYQFLSTTYLHLGM